MTMLRCPSCGDTQLALAASEMTHLCPSKRNEYVTYKPVAGEDTLTTKKKRNERA